MVALGTFLIVTWLMLAALTAYLVSEIPSSERNLSKPLIVRIGLIIFAPITLFVGLLVITAKDSAPMFEEVIKKAFAGSSKNPDES